MKSKNMKKSSAATSKKKFSFSRKQQTVAAVVGVLALGGIGYSIYSASTMDSVGAGGCVSHTYKSGSSGSCVKYIQELTNNAIKRASLNKGSRYASSFGGLSNLTADSRFGEKTKSAITTFQKYVSVSKTGKSNSYQTLSATGNVDTMTWYALCSQGGYNDSAKKYISAYNAAGCASIYNTYKSVSIR